MTAEAVDTSVRKIAGGAENFGSMKEYVKELMRRFDENHDGLITVTELADGLRKMGIFLSSRERQALMNKFDLNRDGEISQEEIYKVLNSTGSTTLSNKALNTSIDHVIKSLADGANSFSSMRDYSRHLIRKFDKDSDGIITFQELCEGLVKLNILISNQEKQALMRKLDIDQDGQITEKEMYRVLSSVEVPHNPKLNSTSQTVESTLRKILSGADDINDLRSYAKKLITKFDKNNDGIISF
jgi:calcium-binding protein CML